MKRIKEIIMSVALVAGVGMTVVSQPAFAVNVFGGCTGQTNTVCQSTGDDAKNVISTVVNLLLYILGAVAIIMIIVGGIMYVTSGGDAGGVKKAKDTITYAIIGLIVAIMAYAIVNFVAKSFGA
jgi:hypothetical protein